MVRPCFLVIDPEHSSSISTRKLVIETAKFNVITAYSAAEAIETLQKFPAVDGVIANTRMHDMPVPDLVRVLKRSKPLTPIIVVGPSFGQEFPEADYQLESFDPSRLIELLRSLQPDKTAVIDEHERTLEETE